MATDPPSPSRPLVTANNTSTSSSPGPFTYTNRAAEPNYPTSGSPLLPTYTRQRTPVEQPVAQQDGYRPLNVKDALTYLDQVKVKFADQPEVYNRFLDIMKEFKSQAIDTPGVIDRVSKLFRGHPLLISGFNTFLPPGYRIECSIDDHARDIIKVTTPSGITSTTTNDYSAERFYPPSTYNGYRPLPPINNYSTTSPPSETPVASAETRRAPVEFNHAINYVNKIKNRFSNDPETYKQFLEILQTYQKEQKPIQEVYAQVQVLFNGANDLLSEFKQFLPDTSNAATATATATPVKGGKKRALVSTTTKQIKKSKKMELLQQQQQQHELSDIRHRSPLIFKEEETRPWVSTDQVAFFEKVKKFINNKTTYHSFLCVLNLFSQQVLDAATLIDKTQSFLGGSKELFDELKKLVGYNEKDVVIENIPAIDIKQAANIEERYGPSYRSVPKSFQNQVCSGRDALCFDVLNDLYVSHPTWASEDGGFIASKKNVFEEALHRVEEERYEYDLNIESNLNTISLLDPVLKKINLMTSEEEKMAFKLPVGLGGPSKSIYQRIIKKVYGKEKGLNVIDLLHNYPSQAVPIILKRLKQKDQEWKKLQRDWNKVWREIEIKNYYKSLDYQGVLFKSVDRKQLSNKHLLNEISSLYLDQQFPQFKFQFKDKHIFKDITRILYSYFERQTTFGTEDCDIMKAFVEIFLPVFFNVPNVVPEIEQDVEMVEEDDLEDESQEDEDSDEEEMSSPRSSSSRHSRRSPRTKTMEDDQKRLLKDVLTKSMKKHKTMILQLEEEEEQVEEEQKMYNLFGNTTFYCFFRLFQICYDRLSQMKQIDRDYRIKPEQTKASNKAALELNTASVNFNSIEIDFKYGYYNALLKLIDRFFDDEIDQHVFEECTRYIFGTQAYPLFTIDKLLLSIMRQLHLIVTEPKAQELLSLFKKYHQYEKSSPTLVQAYRLEVVPLMKPLEDNLYNLAFDTLDRTLSIQLLGKNDEIFVRDVESYQEYVDSWMDWQHETPGISIQHKPFLKRNISSMGQQGEHHSGMQYKICRNTFHMFYVIGTEDAYIHTPSSSITQISSDRFKSWLNRDKSKVQEEEKLRALFS